MSKRKRVKNTVPLHERCCALEQIVNNVHGEKGRRVYCGTHIKGRPHGEVNGQTTHKSVKKRKYGQRIFMVLFIILTQKTTYMIIMIL